MKSHPSHLLLTLLLSLSLPVLTQALEPTITKLHGRATTPPGFNQFGISVAVSDLYILVGERYDNDRGASVGAAHLYDARTGRYLRKLLPPSGTPTNSYYGFSVAVCGNLAVMASYESTAGVIGFDARTGRQLWKLDPRSANDGFGYSVAVSGQTLLVGASYASDNGQPVSGLAYLYNLSGPTPVPTHTLSQSANAAASNLFGSAVALSGDLALVGAFYGAGAQLHDTRTGALLQRWTGSGGFARSAGLDAGRVVVGDELNHQIRVFDARSGTESAYSPLAVPGLYFSKAISVSGNLALIGAAPENGFTGGARLFDLTTGTELRHFTAPDASAGDNFGFSVALCGSRAVVGAHLDADLGFGSGSAYYYRDLSGPLPLATLAQTRNFAPGVVEGDFRAFGDAVINPEGEVAFPATLMGSGAGRGTAAAGVWSDLLSGSLNLIARGGTALGGGLLQNATGKPLFNRASDLVFLGTAKGTGITSKNDAAIFRSNSGGAPAIVVQENSTHATASGAVFSRFYEVAQSHTGTNGDLAVSFQYKNGPGGVGRGSDSGLLAINHDGTVVGTVYDENHIELSSLPSTYWGQFTPRVAKTGSQMAWSAYLLEGGVTSTNNSGLFKVTPGSNESAVARKGDTLFGTTVFNTFVGESISTDGAVLYRATLKGNAANEILFHSSLGYFLKGTILDASNPQITVSRFLKFWPAAGGKWFFLAKLTGRGVNSSNDCALYLADAGGAHLLLREGDYVAGCDRPKVGVIQRVDVDPTDGQYVILTSLTGSSAANQALFTGDSAAGINSDSALRLPVLKLRKGTSYQAPTGSTTKILSLAMANTTDAAGAGAKGGPQVIDANGNVVLCVQFTDRSKHLMKGKP